MPRGDKSAYSEKQKRKAQYIEDSYEERGIPVKEAAARAWATVNKQSGGGDKSGAGRRKSPRSKAASRRTSARRAVATKRGHSPKSRLDDDTQSIEKSGELAMPRCDVCGNDYEHSFDLVVGGKSHTFDCFECAIHAMAPTCVHCGCRILGHGVQDQEHIYCCAHCARESGQHALVDHVGAERAALS